MAPQPEKFKRAIHAENVNGPPIPADIEAHNRMVREKFAAEDRAANKYARKPVAVSLAPLGKRS